MSDEQILLITEKLARFGAQVDNLADIVKDMKRELATKAELAAVQKEVSETRQALKDHVENHKEAPFKKWMTIGTVITGVGTIILAIITLYANYHH